MYFEDVIISNVKVLAESKITFYESGILESVLLSSPACVNNKRYNPDCLLTFSEQGKIGSVNESCGFFTAPQLP